MICSVSKTHRTGEENRDDTDQKSIREGYSAAACTAGAGAAPIYVAADERDVCVGYAFCQLREQPFSNNMVPFRSLFIDDLCVDEKTRGQHVGESLFAFVKEEAKRLGCYEVQLNVWEGNTAAEKFYEKMGMKTKERRMEYILK